MASVLSVGKAQKFQFKIKTNLSFEARINFGKLPETPVTAISLQNLHISGHIETINVKKGYVTFRRNEFSVSPVSTELPNKLVYNSLFHVVFQFSHRPLKNKFCCTTYFKTELNPCSMRFSLLFSFISSVILF